MPSLLFGPWIDTILQTSQLQPQDLVFECCDVWLCYCEGQTEMGLVSSMAFGWTRLGSTLTHGWYAQECLHDVMPA